MEKQYKAIPSVFLNIPRRDGLSLVHSVLTGYSSKDAGLVIRELTNRRLHSRRRRLLLKILDTHAPPDVSSHQASSSERRRLHKALLEVVLARTRLEVCCDYFFLLFLSLPNTKFGT